MIAALIQTRLDSSRFPGKALERIGEFRMIERCVMNVKKSKYFRPVLLTSDRPVDTPLEEIAEELGIDCFRGDIDNVAKRTLDCVSSMNISVFARVNGDSPFVMASLLDEGYEIMENQKCDFVTNIIERTFPYGISVEVFRSDAFAIAYNEIKNDSYLCEHHTSFFYKNPGRFRYFSMTRTPDLSGLRLTVDQPGDMEHIRKMYTANPDIFNLDIDNLASIYFQTKI